MYCTLIGVLIVDIFNGYVLNICYVHQTSGYAPNYVLLYPVKPVHLLLINGSERG